MPRYRLHLHNGPTTPPETDFVSAQGDEDVRDIAMISLLATTQFTHVEVYEGDRCVHALKRDSYRPE